MTSARKRLPRAAAAAPAAVPGRRGRLGNGYIGRRERADGFVLRRGLPGPGQVGLDEALALVVADYRRQAREGRIAQRSGQSYSTLATEIIQFAKQLGARQLGDVDDALAEKYVWADNAPNARRAHQPPRPDTLARRRGGVRALFDTARALGLDDRPVGAVLVIPTKTSPEAAHDPDDDASSACQTRAFTDAEADKARWGGRGRTTDSRLPAATDLALMGCGTGAMGWVLVGHVRLDGALVWCPGEGRSYGRWLRLDEHAIGTFDRHITYLARQIPAADLPGTPLVAVGPQRQRKVPSAAKDERNSTQSQMSGLLRRVLVGSGLASVPGLRPQSFAMWAAVREFDRTGAVEAAAVVLGIADLNTAAAIVGFDWRAACAFDAPRTPTPATATATATGTSRAATPAATDTPTTDTTDSAELTATGSPRPRQEDHA